MLNSDVDFNPRLREGGDGFYWSKHCKRCLISIHASAKEATFEHLLYVLDEHIFQSTPPRRRRRNQWHIAPCCIMISIHASAKEATLLFVMLSQMFYFNPRLREGGDHYWLWYLISQLYFNPRLREGGDFPLRKRSFLSPISIHASAKEATATYCDTSAIMYISSLNNFFVHFF